MGYVTSGEHPRRFAWQLSTHEIVLAVLSVAFLVVKYRLLAKININWDEFAYLSRVYEFHRGDLTTAFQTFHVNLFSWLVRVPGNEIDQIIAVRHVAYALRIGSVVLIFLLGLRLLGRTGAFVAVLASLSFSFLLRHGEAFRADPLIAFLFLASVTLLLWTFESRLAIVIAAAVMALAVTISVKAVIYLPAIASILAILCWSGMRGRRAASYAIAAAVVYLILHLFHSTMIAAPDDPVVGRAAAVGAGMWWNPRFEVLARTLRWDWPFWSLFGIGTAFAIHDAVRGGGERRLGALLLLSLLLPLASLSLYRNTFQYFYVTIIPAASLGCGYAVSRIEGLCERWRVWQPLIVLVLAAPLAMKGYDYMPRLRYNQIIPQRDVVAAVHSIFPEPVPYLDRCGMVASFPRANMFMSTFVLESYRERGVAVMERLVAERQPHFVLANVVGLALERPWNELHDSPHRLLREDFDYLRDNFIHHWGPIWVPGKRIDLEADREVAVTLVVGGNYTVESDGRVAINGVSTPPDSVVALEAGVHTVRGLGRTASVILRFGARLHRPEVNPPAQSLFRSL